MQKITKEKGFTLIELLVVIGIIVILSTFVMASISSARIKGRDARRLADIKAIQTALENFFDSCVLGYPNNPSGLSLTVSSPAWGDGAANCGGNTALMSTFLPQTPVNVSPANGTPDYAYRSINGRANYQITFGLEMPSGSLSAGTHTASGGGVQ